MKGLRREFLAVESSLKDAKKVQLNIIKQMFHILAILHFIFVLISLYMFFVICNHRFVFVALRFQHAISEEVRQARRNVSRDIQC